MHSYTYTITNIINLSYNIGVFPDHFKTCSVCPLLKKYNFDKELKEDVPVSNYRSIVTVGYLSLT
jgi:hypothetical protein